MKKEMGVWPVKLEAASASAAKVAFWKTGGGLFSGAGAGVGAAAVAGPR